MAISTADALFARSIGRDHAELNGHAHDLKSQHVSGQACSSAVQCFVWIFDFPQRFLSGFTGPGSGAHTGPADARVRVALPPLPDTSLVVGSALLDVDIAPSSELPDALRRDIELVASLPIVRRILDACRGDTGMRFAAVVRVTDKRWIACRSSDALGFGLRPGDQLPVGTTLCADVLAMGGEVAFDDARADERYNDHPFPATYGLRSAISVPLCLPGGEVFGTLCAADPDPARVTDTRTIERFRLHAELLSLHIDAAQRLDARTVEFACESEYGELREQLLAVLGHDLRNPLGAIDANAQLIEALAEHEDVLEASRAIGRSVHRMGELVGNLLDLTRAKRGALMLVQIDDAPELGDRLRQVIQELVIAHPDRRIETRLEAHAGLRCDADRVAQLLSNLLGNALEHGSDVRPVLVETSVVDGCFRLVVDNAGTPIPPVVRARLFQPFRRSDEVGEADVTAGAMSGLGLGLYISHEIAVAHGGTLECRSDAAGTRFTFAMTLFPVASCSERESSDD